MKLKKGEAASKGKMGKKVWKILREGGNDVTSLALSLRFFYLETFEGLMRKELKLCLRLAEDEIFYL